MDQDNLDRIKPGMTKEQVVFLIGDAPIRDPFHPNRWDYIYTFKSSADGTTGKHVVLRFDGDKLTSMSQNELPSKEPEAK